MGEFDGTQLPGSPNLRGLWVQEYVHNIHKRREGGVSEPFPVFKHFDRERRGDYWPLLRQTSTGDSHPASDPAPNWESSSSWTQTVEADGPRTYRVPPLVSSEIFQKGP